MRNVAIVVLVSGLLGSVVAWQPSGSGDGNAPVAYPDGYRNWAHVKSTLVGPAHASFATIGGYQHIYANPEGLAGYRTRVFPEGSILVVDWLDMEDRNGAYTEGARRQVDVMVKDSLRFATSGGWGFQRFVKDSRTEVSTTLTPPQCLACHEKLKKDGLVLSTYRQ